VSGSVSGTTLIPDRGRRYTCGWRRGPPDYLPGATYFQGTGLYVGDMTTTTLSPGPTVHGGTALGVRPGHSRHLLGSALRAVRVFAVTAAEVVLLGREGKRY
jgi:hypothetical protein